MTHTPESTPALEPCPFCGGEAAFNGIEMQVQCKTSACTGQSWMFDTKDEAIAAWNKRTPPASQSDEALINVGPINRIPGTDSISCPGLPSGMMCLGWGEQGWAINDKDGKRIAAGNWGECATLPASQSEALVTQADREAVKRHQQRFLAEGTSETKLLLEAFASHRLATLRAVWTPVDVVGLGARMATLADSNALPTTIQLIVDMYDALERLSHERASARAEGRREGLEEAAKVAEGVLGVNAAAIRAMKEEPKI